MTAVRSCTAPGCEGDPFFVHVSQVDPLRTIPANAKILGDCASCAARGTRCPGYAGPPRPAGDFEAAPLRGRRP